MPLKTALIISLCLILSACLSAAEPTLNTTEPMPKTKLAPTPLSGPKSAPITGLELISSKQDTLGFTHHKYRQVFQGIPLFASDIIIHTKADKSVYRVDGEFMQVSENFTVEHSVSEEQAINFAIQNQQSADSWTALQAQKIIFAKQESSQAAWQLVWQISLANGPLQQNVLVDADSGKILKTINTFATQVNPQ